LPIDEPWRRYEAELDRLLAENAAEHPVPPIHAWTAPEQPPPPHILAAAAEVSATPTVLWDVPGLDNHVSRMRTLLSAHGVGLSVALKACNTTTVLARLAGQGITADAATIGEWRLSRAAGFNKVTVCGPLFRDAELQEILRGGALFDAQSPGQIEQLIAVGAGEPAGLRLRVPLPSPLRSSTSRGANSRFGVPITPELLGVLDSARQPIRRVRTHTGEATPATLRFRLRYAMLVAELLGTVDQVNLGGGLLEFSRNTDQLGRVLESFEPLLAPAVAAGTRFWVEPGAGLLLDHAYLITEVVDVDPVTVVDASPWNLAPWAYPSYWAVSPRPDPLIGPFYGPTFYEKDRFRPDGDTAGGRSPKRGERVVVTSFGAYTLVHGRRFGEIPLPSQHLVTMEGLRDANVHA
jgi:diaminopimelate decarboxylase